MSGELFNSPFFAIFSVSILMAVAIHPAVDPFWNYVNSLPDEDRFEITVPKSSSVINEHSALNVQQKSDINVSKLNQIASDNSDTDTDEDGLYDSVEIVLGTDYKNNDSDFDQLKDYDEVINGSDPLNPDSNYDGLSDYIEINNVSLDIDDDDVNNIWDVDNDNDGVTDDKDLSPFSKSKINSSFTFDIRTNGNPIFMNYQIRPEDTNHLTLPLQFWDWPDDDQGLMRDLNDTGKDEDVFILPFLETIIQADFRIISNMSGKCLEVKNASEEENEVIWQMTYSGTNNQHWSIEPVSEGFFRIIARHSGKCLEVENASFDDNASIIQGIYEGKDNQHWKLELVDNNSYILKVKHSSKCLQLINAGNDDNITVSQSRYIGGSHQIWIIESVGDVIPDILDLADYGITLDLNKMLIPLMPIWDDGVVPAFNGKMFYPALSKTLNLTYDTKLLWKVFGKTDTALKAFTSFDGKIVSANNTGNAIFANKSVIGDYETFELVDLGGDRVALKTFDGNFIGFEERFYHPSSSSWLGIDLLVSDVVTYYRLVGNSTSIGENETFEIVEIDTNKIALKAKNDLYVSTNFAYDSPGRLTATGKSIGLAETFTVTDLGYKSDTIPIVSYYEDFMLTGFTIQENYGSDIALFYDDEIDDTIRAGFIVAYEFLRSQNSLRDIPEIIQGNNITIESITTNNSIAHQDEAMLKLMGEMLPDVIGRLANSSVNTSIPIIITMEDNFTSTSMDQLTTSLYLDDFNIFIDVTNLPVITGKLFKMNWYNITNNSMLNTEDLLLESTRWALDIGFNETDDEFLTILALFNVWNSGEYQITKIGDFRIDWDLPEAPLILDILTTGHLTLERVRGILENLHKFSTGQYRYLVKLGNFLKKLVKPLVSAIKAGLKVLRLNKVALKALNALKAFAKAIKSSKAVQSAMKVFRSTRFISAIDKLSLVLTLIDIAITGVIAFYMFWSILFSEGFSDFGAVMGAWVVIFSFAYWGVMTLIMLAIPVLGVILAILDAIFDFFGKALEWFLDLITKAEIRSEFDLGFIGSPTLDVHDYDNNGFDVGDRVEFLAQIWGKVWKTSDGSKSDIIDSYVKPSLTISVPTGTPTGSWNIKTLTVTDDGDSFVETGETFRYETYDSGVWADPISMINFPMTVQLKYSYKRYYDECIWFFGWWCDRESDSDTITTDISTLYFDVAPGNLSYFLYWNELTCLDSDGDGLSDEDELIYISNPWRVDTDGDGLWDRYEVDLGMLPFKSDSDGDGLDDGLEIRFDIDFNNTDLDDDGLTDYEEFRGWFVDFNFYGTYFKMNVSSDPARNDTDEDGLSDLEEYMRGLNPCTNDTDANGILDPDEDVFPYQGFIESIDLNGRGSSIRIMPNATINASVAYRVAGMNCTLDSQPANCSIFLTLEHNVTGEVILNKTIYQGNQTRNIVTVNNTNFTFNASEFEGLYLMKYFVNWSCYGIMPPSDLREIIGIIDVNISGSGRLRWICGDINGGDYDGDGISNINENIGWPVTYTDSTGTYTIFVTSDTKSIDTDSDGERDIWEHNCFENSTNPRNPDTDNDGLTDWEEKYRYETNPLDYDTDGDGLDDQNELIFNSDPFEYDTDFDGLNDLEEFMLNSNPNDPDTDNDGLNDYVEWIFNSSPLLPDTDYDNLFDLSEYNLTTDPRDPDTDDDELIDGYEILFNTDPKRNDTDSDMLIDGEEVYWSTNATIVDTDKDGLLDGDEIKYGTHPLISDTDRDGVNDSVDYDTYTSHVDDTILVYDLDENILEFEEHLKEYTSVTTISTHDLLTNPLYKMASNIILVGRLDAGSSTAGNLSKNILESTGENISLILENGYKFFAVKYGIWNATQTIVMLSKPYRLDHLIALGLLKNLRKIISDNSVEIVFPTPRDFFRIETIKELDTLIWVELNETVTPWMRIDRFNASSAPIRITHSNSLGNFKPLDKYIRINVSENIQNDTVDIVNDAWIIIYYTASDLDRTGDGDGNDIDDIKENMLSLYFYDEVVGRWKQLDDNMDWVFDMGVDTTNVKIYNRSYEGFIWAHVSHFSTFGLVGLFPPYYPNSLPISDANGPYFGVIDEEIVFDGSGSFDTDGDITNFSWDFGDESMGYGINAMHVYEKSGVFNVVLTVTDDQGAMGIDETTVIVSKPNLSPTAPIIEGFSSGTKNTLYYYSAVSTDPDNDSIIYSFIWGDYTSYVNESGFLPSGSVFTASHIWTVAGIYTITVKAYDNETYSETSYYTVLIDALLVDDIGFFTDDDADGVYDLFHGEEIVTSLGRFDDGYLIDNDGDGEWDYLYDIISKKIIDYEESGEKVSKDTDITVSVIILGLLAIILFIIFSGFIQLNKRKKKK